MTTGPTDNQPARPDGRVVNEGHRYKSDRTPAQRDRDRILYSSAFRRLGFITQVAWPHEHHYHNRLIHSVKVAQVARRLAERVRSAPDLKSRSIVVDLDPDAAEAAGLAHDIGHPPFGHIGEQALAHCMRENGGFDSNAQAFRTVALLAAGTVEGTGYRGFNLTLRVLNGILKYPWREDHAPTGSRKYGVYREESRAFEIARRLAPWDIPSNTKNADMQRSIEAELMDWADDITYAVHDLEDFFRVGRIEIDLLVKDATKRTRFLASLRREAARRRLKDFSETQVAEAAERLFSVHLVDIRYPYDGTFFLRRDVRHVMADLIGRYMTALVVPPEPVGRALSLVTIDPLCKAEVGVLKELVWFYVIDRQALQEEQKAQRVAIRALFRHWTAQANRRGGARGLNLPPPLADAVLRGPGDGKGPDETQQRARIVADYIAGLTDREALDAYRKLCRSHPDRQSW